MIRYRLGCGSGHEFESWFPAIDAFDAQLRSGAVACPICGSTEIAKQPMAPAVVTSRSRRSRSERTGNSGRGGPAETAVPAQAQTQPPTRAAAGGDGAAARIGMLRDLKERIVQSSEDVGSRFADEARKMHFGEIEERNIRGNSTVEEARELVEDGVPFGLMPALPEDLN